MPWKKKENDDKALVLDDKGNPVWVNDAGEEKGVDHQAMSAALAKANKEAAERRVALDEAKKELARFEGIDDPDAARKAMETVAALPDKDKALEEQLQARLKPLQEGFAAKMAAKDKAIEEMNRTAADMGEKLERETVTHAFFQSPYVGDKLSSRTLAASLFAPRFALRDGALVGLEESGDPIYGDDGAAASFDHALAKMVEASPDKGLLLKGNDKSGSGSKPSGSMKALETNPTSSRANIEAGLRAGLLK